MSVRQPTLQDMVPFFAEETAVQWLVQLGMSSIGEPCECGAGTFQVYAGEPTLRCNHCRHRCALFHDTFFEKVKMPIGHVIILGYLWAEGASLHVMETLIGCSHETACQYKRHLEELVSYMVQDSRQKIGGPGVIVEMDESKFGHRKYNRGHRVESPWIVGGVERTPARRMFAQSVTSRDGELLATVILDNIEPGTILYTDGWAGYVRAVEIIRAQGFPLEHRVVNHSVEFVADDGTHTNTIEATWSGIKTTMSAREKNCGSIDTKLLAFMWRRQNAGNTWKALVEAWKTIRYNQDDE